MPAVTLSEWAKRVDPDGKIDKVAELLAQKNEILEDAVWIEGNLPTGHRTTVRTDLPTVSWRKLNYGVKPSKSKTKQVDDTCGILESYAEVDKDLAVLNGLKESFLLSENKPFIEAMNQEFSRTFVYGDTALHPERFLGLTGRFNSLEHENIIDCGGVGNKCTSMWLVCWSDETVHMTFPKGSTAGLTSNFLGEVTLEDDSGGKYQGFRSHYQWKPGLVVRDWRYIVRLANIDVSDLENVTMVNNLIRAINRLPATNAGKNVLYCNRDIHTALSIEATNKKNVMLSIDNWDGKQVTSFQGIPLRKVDQILSTEAALTV